MPKPPRIDEQVSLNRAFLVCAVLFGLVTVWAVYDELYTRRPWKTTQVEFFKLEERLARADLETRKKALDGNAGYAAKKAERARLEGELSGPKRGALEKARAELTAREYEAFDAEQEFTFAKSEWEEAYYYWTRAKHDGSLREDERERARETLKKAKAAEDERKAAFDEVAGKRDASAAQVGEFTKRIGELGKEIEKLEQDVADAKRKWEDAKHRASLGDIATKIEQFNLEGTLGRVDRCHTCHLGIDRAGFEKVEPAVYRTHPLRRTLLRYHPADKFGCTICHDGQGRATYVKRAVFSDEVVADFPHAPEGHTFHAHYWERPVLTGPDEKGAPDWYRESTCQNCHVEQWDLRSNIPCETDVDCPDKLTCGVPPAMPGAAAPSANGTPQKVCLDPATERPVLWDLAPHLARGKKVIEELGCYGCHPIAGYESKPKPAPDLRRAASKIDPAWMIEWIKHPTGIRPATRMPNFYPEALSTEGYPVTALLGPDGKPVDFKRRRDEESAALAAFLLAKSEPFDLDRAPPGDAARGKALFESVGCLGCHTGLGDRNVEHKNRATHFDHGPDLGGIGSKTTADWLYTWLMNPKRYNPTARMPNLRLATEEAADLAAFLAAQKDAKRSFALPPGFDPTNAALIEQGQKIVGERGCFGCHLIAGFEATPGIGVELSEFGAKTVDRLDFGDYVTDHDLMTWDRWTYHKLKRPRVYRYERVDTSMPQHDLTDEEIWSVMTVLRGMRGAEFVGPLAVKLDGAGKARERGRELVRFYNCHGCHTVDGRDGDIRQIYPGDMATFAPPNLLGEGAKTQPAWLFGFLKNVVPLRPWLSIRMPTFDLSDEQATALTGMFSALDGAEYPYRYYGDTRLEGAPREVAQQLFYEDFKCTSCHLVGEKTLTPDEAAKAAPNLQLAKQRLRGEWIASWIDDPQPWMPGTRMPSFFPGGVDLLDLMLQTPATAARFKGMEDVAKRHGKRADTIRLLSDFLMTLEEAPQAAAP